MTDEDRRAERLEAALEAAERRYHVLFEKNVAGVARGTFDAVVLECNPAFAEIFGYDDPAELMEAEPGRLLVDDEARTAFLERLRERGEVRSVQLEARTRDGEPIWILASSSVVEGEGRDEIVTTVVDVTDRVEAERARRASESRLRAMANQMPAVVWTVNRDLEFVSSLGAGLEGLGLEPGEVTGTTLYDYFDTDDPDFQPIAMHRKAVEGQAATYMFEWEGRSFRTHVEPLRDPDGEIAGAVGVAHDVTPLVEAEQEARESERRFRSLFEESMDAIFLTDRSGMVELANGAAADLAGVEDEEELTGVPVSALLEGDAWRGLLRRVRRHGHVEGYEARAVPRSGEEAPDVQITATPRRSDGEVVGYQAIVRDVTERKAFERRLERRALHDQLTGLPNRTLFWDRLGHALDRAAREDVTVAVCFIDMDGFKVVNDERGHSAGDRVLEEVARRIRGSFRQEDTVARFGGDEFTVLLEDVGDRSTLDQAAERLAGLMEEPVRLEEASYRLSASIGIALADGPGVGPDELVRRADSAMYRAKEREGTAHCLWTPEQEEAGKPG